MNKLTTYLINSLVREKEQKIEDQKNRRNNIDLNKYFKETDKIEIKGKFVSACKFPMPIPERVLIKNDMSKYKLINRYERNKERT